MRAGKVALYYALISLGGWAVLGYAAAAAFYALTGHGDPAWGYFVGATRIALDTMVMLGLLVAEGRCRESAGRAETGRG